MSLNLFSTSEFHLTSDQRIDSTFFLQNHDHSNKRQAEHPDNQPTVERCRVKYPADEQHRIRPHVVRCDDIEKLTNFFVIIRFLEVIRPEQSDTHNISQKNQKPIVAARYEVKQNLAENLCHNKDDFSQRILSSSSVLRCHSRLEEC